MKKRLYVISLIAVIAIFTYLIFFGSKGVSITGKSAAPDAKLFTSYCMPCHGEAGKGDGQLAYLLYPKPRNFTKGVFKLRSTPTGQVPTDADLEGTIRNGMPGTAMPSFYFLNGDQIKLLTGYVKQLSQECSEPGKPCRNFFADQNPQPIPVPDLLPRSDSLLERGKSAYSQLGCVQCHGESGKGDGVSAAELKDDWGYPIKVRDFTQGVYVGGGEPKDLYVRFLAGLNGTPMPSYADTIKYLGQTDQERQEIVWGLIHYVKNLETEQAKANQAKPPKDGILLAEKTGENKTEAELTDAHHPDWEKASAVAIPISRLWQRDSTNSSLVNVRTLYNKDYLAMMLEWNDPSMDAGNYRVQDFQDGAAVQFSMTEIPGFQGMGQTSNPCNLWFWRSEWQMRADAKLKADIKYAYRNRASDSDVTTYPAEMQDEAILAGRDAVNPVSLQTIKSPVEDLNAKGPGTLTSQPPKEQNVMGKGVWDGKTWRVVFVRKLRNGEPNDVQLKENNLYPIAFAVWNGMEKDRNGQKLISTWYSLRFQQ